MPPKQSNALRTWEITQSERFINYLCSPRTEIYIQQKARIDSPLPPTQETTSLPPLSNPPQQTWTSAYICKSESEGEDDSDFDIYSNHSSDDSSIEEPLLGLTKDGFAIVHTIIARLWNSTDASEMSFKNLNARILTFPFYISSHVVVLGYESCLP